MYRRTVEGRLLDFGTTGLLRNSNLVMYDRQTESWWQEFGGEAIVGDLTGRKLEWLPLSIVSWKEFRATHPKGKVLSRETGHERPYGRNPYTGYDTSEGPFLFIGRLDLRVDPLERVVGLDLNGESLAIPYSVLRKQPVLQVAVGRRPLVAFYQKGTASALDDVYVAEGRDIGSAAVFDPSVDGTALHFVMRDSRFVDEETGSTWNLLGIADSGPLTGKQITPIPHLNAFWFAWAVFKPDTKIYGGG